MRLTDRQLRDGIAGPFYFRQPDKPLFGFYHPPHGASPRAAGVVLCQPQAHEYILCHRAFRLLAEQLSRSGFPTLRFDYYACGDSAGDASEGDLEQWVEDISAAVQECRARSGKKRIAAVGLRLGGSLTLLPADGAPPLDSLVLWDPVTSGPRYLEELERLHAELKRNLPRGGPEGAAPRGSSELVGVIYSARLVQQLRELDLSRAGPRGIERILLVETEPRQGESDHTELFSFLAGRVDHAAVWGPRIWLPHVDGPLDRALVPKSILQTIVSWLDEVYP